MFFSFWGPTEIAHTIMSWSFADGPALAISIETRKEKGESYSALLGFFRQYELYYVVARERDVIGVRDRFRGEHTYLYRLSAPPELARDAPALLREGDQPDRRAPGVVQRVHRELHDVDPQPRAPRGRARCRSTGACSRTGICPSSCTSAARSTRACRSRSSSRRARSPSARRPPGDAEDFSQQIRAGLPRIGEAHHERSDREPSRSRRADRAWRVLDADRARARRSGPARKTGARARRCSAGCPLFVLSALAGLARGDRVDVPFLQRLRRLHALPADDPPARARRRRGRRPDPRRRRALRDGRADRTRRAAGLPALLESLAAPGRLALGRVRDAGARLSDQLLGRADGAPRRLRELARAARRRRRDAHAPRAGGTRWSACRCSSSCSCAGSSAGSSGHARSRASRGWTCDLVATHPDRAGGLAFVALGQSGFAILVLGASASLAGKLADEVVYRGVPLESLYPSHGGVRGGRHADRAGAAAHLRAEARRAEARRAVQLRQAVEPPRRRVRGEVARRRPTRRRCSAIPIHRRSPISRRATSARGRCDRFP